MIVTIIGTGYVGLVTGACLASIGHTVRCVDVSEERVNLIRAGQSPFYEPRLEELLRVGLASGRLSVTTSLASAIEGSEVSLIAVGTPAKGEEPDLSFLETAAAQIGEQLRALGRYHVVAVKSTVVPTTTRNLVQPRLEIASGLRLGEFGLCMNPEFLREGSAVEDFCVPDRIVIGQADKRSGDVLERLYHPYTCDKLRVSLEEAELTKYASNCLLSVLISFSNELAGLCESTPGADVENVMDALYLDRRLSPAGPVDRVRPGILSYLRAGIGFGGSCLPKDVNALRVYGKRIAVVTPLLDAIVATNAHRPTKIVDRAEAALGGLRGKTIALLGLAFKSGTDDLRSSPALAILRTLENRGAQVRAYDPFVRPEAAARAGVQAPCGADLKAILTGADAALITTADPTYRTADWAGLTAAMRAPVLIDGRNVLRGVPLPAAVRYYPIGVAWGRQAAGGPDTGRIVGTPVRSADLAAVRKAH
jgi:UDPglucose 6-dehydrogenase/GDP-mannose 6-dehydrogenase